MGQRVFVKGVWDSWEDRVAHNLAYGPIGEYRHKRWLRSVSVPGRLRSKAAKFCEARKRWNSYVTQARLAGYLDSESAMRLRNCRVAGVNLSGSFAKYACRHAFCPYCYYRKIFKRLKKIQWSRSALLDLMVWQAGISSDSVSNSIAARYARQYPCREAKVAMAKLVKRGANILQASRLWTQVEEDGFCHFHQNVLVSQNLTAEADKWAFIREDNVVVRRAVRATSALMALGYCPGWLKLPWDVGLHVSVWNRSFRFSAKGAT